MELASPKVCLITMLCLEAISNVVCELAAFLYLQWLLTQSGNSLNTLLRMFVTILDGLFA